LLYSLLYAQDYPVYCDSYSLLYAQDYPVYCDSYSRIYVALYFFVICAISDKHLPPPLKVHHDEIGWNCAIVVLDYMYLLQLLFQHQNYELICNSKSVKASLPGTEI